jgi:hypothetical protein
MPRPGLTIAQLQRILEQRRDELQKLRQERTDLQKEINALDRRIDRLEGGVGGRGGGVRMRNKTPLPTAIANVMRENGKPMRVMDIMNGVLESGYRSSSDKFRGIVNQTLIKDKNFTQVDRGVYQLKK